MACRQTHSIWFYIKKVIFPYSKSYGRWKCFKELLNLDITNKYFWHDSFGKFINRYTICKIKGHKNVHWLSEGGCDDNRPKHYCFNCEKEVNPGVDKINEKSSIY
ncbi:MAG: hypothetical protein KKD48_05250 [Nanoarchaeota archaeon]|nr:hypothetical protein [Nanoarchaeota archaeon]